MNQPQDPSSSASAASDPAAIWKAGVGELNAGRFAAAAQIARSGLARHDGDARLWQLLALASRGLDEMGDAISAFERAAALNPADPLIAHGLARSQLEAGLSSTASFENARRLAPEDRDILRGLAAARYADRDIDGAIAELDRELARAPDWQEGQATVARLRWISGQRSGHLSSLDTAIAARPRAVALWQQRINLLVDSENYSDALATVERARSATGDRQAFDWHYAVCCAELGMTSEADKAFGQLGRQQPLQTIVRVVRHLLRAGRIELAARTAEANAPHDPTYQLWPYLASAWRLLGDPRWNWLEGDPRLVGIYDLADRIDMDGLAACLRRLHLASDQPMEQSLRGGTQTDGPLYSRLEPEIRELRRQIVAVVQQHIAQLPPVDPRHPILKERRDAAVGFSGSWSVRLTDKGFHVDHVHPAGWFSSAFYVTLPKASMGGAASDGYFTLGELRDLLPDLKPFRLIEPAEGRLVLFPSTMWHGTRPFEKGERMTVAFDIARPPR